MGTTWVFSPLGMVADLEFVCMPNNPPKHNYLIATENPVELFTAPGLSFVFKLGFNRFYPHSLVLILAHFPHMVNRTNSELA